MTIKSSNLYQYFAALVVNILSLLYGIALGWPSSNVVLLLSDESPLPSGKLNIDEASWVVGLLCVGGFIGNLLFGYITDKFGRKEPLLSLALPCTLSWLLILYGQNVNYLYAARLFIGLFGGGVFVIIPQFLSDIACDSIRGILGSTFIFSVNTGMLLAFVLGNYCDYETIPKIAIVYSLAFVFAFYIFPESPSILVKQNRISEAEQSIRFYRHIESKANDSDVLRLEMNKLKSPFGSFCTPGESDGLKLADFKTKEARKAMTIGIALVLLLQFSGCIAMLSYTAIIFKESGSSMPPNMSAIVVGAIQLIGSCCSTVLVDRAGRKFLLVASALGIASGLTVLATYSTLKSHGYEVESFNWIPISSFSFTIFIASMGVLTLPFLVISEIMPEKLKNFGSSFCTLLLWFIAFVMLKFFPLLSNTFGMHGSLFMFAGCSVSGALFICLVLPETKGKGYEEIMQALR